MHLSSVPLEVNAKEKAYFKVNPFVHMYQHPFAHDSEIYLFCQHLQTTNNEPFVVQICCGGRLCLEILESKLLRAGGYSYRLHIAVERTLLVKE